MIVILKNLVLVACTDYFYISSGIMHIARGWHLAPGESIGPTTAGLGRVNMYRVDYIKPENPESRPWRFGSRYGLVKEYYRRYRVWRDDKKSRIIPKL